MGERTTECERCGYLVRWDPETRRGPTVFFEEGGEEVGNAVLDASALPEAARHDDAILRVTVLDGSLVGSEYDAERTADRAERAQDRFDRLSERPPSDGES